MLVNDEARNAEITQIGTWLRLVDSLPDRVSKFCTTAVASDKDAPRQIMNISNAHLNRRTALEILGEACSNQTLASAIAKLVPQLTKIGTTPKNVGDGNVSCDFVP